MIQLLKELFEFLKHRKKIWLYPVIVLLVIVGLVVILGGTSLAPFLYLGLW